MNTRDVETTIQIEIASILQLNYSLFGHGHQKWARLSVSRIAFYPICHCKSIQTLISRLNLIQFCIGTKWSLFNVSMKTLWLTTDLNRMGEPFWKFIQNYWCCLSKDLFNENSQQQKNWKSAFIHGRSGNDSFAVSFHFLTGLDYIYRK